MKLLVVIFSPPLLDIARSKAKEMNRNIIFIGCDMRNVKAGKFDAVITIFNAIGHLTKADFETALQNIHTNLKDDGVYIFDIFNLQALTDKITMILRMILRALLMVSTFATSNILRLTENMVF